MKFLLLNQAFYPDVVSTGQHLTDLALGLIARGHEVTVVTSRRAYDNPQKMFPAHEIWCGIRIIRVSSTGLGKGAKWKRAVDFGTFTAFCLLRMLRLPRHDVVVALTSPPLIAFFGAWLARIRRGKFVYWVMDFNPDQAIAAGWLKPRSLAARLLERMSRFSLEHACRIIALDRFMRDRIVAKGIPSLKIVVLAPWSHDDQVQFAPAERERFRQAHGMNGKFVVMYSGNHSPCHPLDTLLESARRLAHNPDVQFCFIGGGSEFHRIKQWLHTERLSNALCLPYQPLDQLAGSLSAADLHVVVMGEPFVGLVHPCKIYNILNVAAPVLYIGPQPSHVAEILAAANGQVLSATARHGDVEAVVQQVERLRQLTGNASRRPPDPICARFAKDTLLPKLISELESVA